MALRRFECPGERGVRMKRFLVLSGIVLIVLVAVYRQRLFLRDPLAKVYRDGARQEGVRVYINYSNDVLLERPGDELPYRMVQHWNKTPGVPQLLTCMRAMVCWSDHDQATLVPLGSAGATTMSDREVSFSQRDGSVLRVTLR
jgi:hypothetical protein